MSSETSESERKVQLPKQSPDNLFAGRRERKNSQESPPLSTVEQQRSLDKHLTQVLTFSNEGNHTSTDTKISGAPNRVYSSLQL